MPETRYATIGGTRGTRPKVFRLLTRVAGARSAYLLLRMFDMLTFLARGMPRYAVGSIDITYRCNLKCTHCYFLQQDYDTELTDAQWIARMDHWRDHTDFPFYQCSWVGGEPLLRKDLIAKLMGRFKSNMVVTNGSIALPDWRDCNFYVSVDGTREHHEKIRGDGGLYDRIKANVNNAPQLKITVAMVVNRENWRCIPAFVDEWMRTRVRGVLFEFFTPVEGVADELWPPWELRDHILEMLIRLKRTYGDFIINTVGQLRLMKSRTAPGITRECAYARIAYTLGPDGKPKRPCPMGEKADCGRCGCLLPFLSWELEHQNIVVRELVRSVRKFIYNRWLPERRIKGSRAGKR